jgi:endonuclease/exonuclease/phosphatase family metal-dependent hydrolase
MLGEDSTCPMSLKPVSVPRVAGRSLLSFLGLIFVALISQSAPAQLRVVTYATDGGPNDGLLTVLEAIAQESVNGFIDVLALQKQRGRGETTSDILDLLNDVYGPGTYAMADVEGEQTPGSRGLPALIYNRNTVELIGQDAIGVASTAGQPRQTLRYQLRPAGYGPSADFYVYNSHYKTGTGTKNEGRRNVEAVAIRANLDGRGDGVHAILAGDFNVYRDSEPMYRTLLAEGPGQAFDPIGLPGSWSGDEAFKAIHTQAPSVGGGSGGGMNDRFDFQLVTDEFLDDQGLDYIEETYHAFGNDGRHDLDGDISSGTGARRSWTAC